MQFFIVPFFYLNNNNNLYFKVRLWFLKPYNFNAVIIPPFDSIRLEEQISWKLVLLIKCIL